MSSTAGRLAHVTRAGVGALVDPADGPSHLRRTASRAADTVRRQVLVQQTVLAGRTADPVARACGQLRRSAPYLQLHTFIDIHYTTSTSHISRPATVRGKLSSHRAGGADESAIASRRKSGWTKGAERQDRQRVGQLALVLRWPTQK